MVYLFLFFSLERSNINIASTAIIFADLRDRVKEENERDREEWEIKIYKYIYIHKETENKK